MLTEKRRKSLPIAARRLLENGLALSVTFGDTSPKGRGLSKAVQEFDLEIKRIIKEKLLC